MGVYLSKANTEKESEFGSSGLSSFGLTSMQGWRQSMEDAHVAVPSIVMGDCTASIYGVFDGHGGAAVSEWIARHMIEVVQQELKAVMSSADTSDVTADIVAETFQRTFLELDQYMQTKQNLREISRIAENITDDSDPQLSNLLNSQPQTVLNSFIQSSNCEDPQLKIVDQDGEETIDIQDLLAAVDKDIETTDNERITNEKASDSDDGEDDGDFDPRSGVPETCGAAVVVATILSTPKGSYLVTANAGDSRCVLSRNGRAVAQSEDHKPMQEREMLRIYAAGGYVDNGRVDGNLNLSRTLGDLFYKRNDQKPQREQKISAFPDVLITPLHKDDEFVIVACDGIWDCLTNQQAVDFVKERLKESPQPDDLAKICEEMCDACVAAHPFESDGGIGCDNMTAMVVLLNEEIRQKATEMKLDSRLY